MGKPISVDAVRDSYPLVFTPLDMFPWVRCGYGYTRTAHVCTPQVIAFYSLWQMQVICNIFIRFPSPSQYDLHDIKDQPSKFVLTQNQRSTKLTNR